MKAIIILSLLFLFSCTQKPKNEPFKTATKVDSTLLKIIEFDARLDSFIYYTNKCNAEDSRFLHYYEKQSYYLFKKEDYKMAEKYLDSMELSLEISKKYRNKLNEF